MMKSFLSLATLVALLGAADIEYTGAMAKASGENAKATGVFLQLSNKSDKDVKFLGGSSSIGDNIEIHGHSKDGKDITELVIPAKGEVVLMPGASHFKMTGLKKQVKPGDKFDIQLKFDNGETLEVKDIEAIDMSEMQKSMRRAGGSKCKGHSHGEGHTHSKGHSHDHAGHNH